MSTINRVVALASAAVALATWSAAAKPSGVPYPEGFRRWTHVKSELSAPKSDADTRAGVHHIYANPLAMRGYESGRFPEGSVIVFDLLAVSTENEITKEGARKLIDVMHKDSVRFAATGGWGFEEFTADGRVGVIGDRAGAACFQCHTQRKAHDFVFSTLQP